MRFPRLSDYDGDRDAYESAYCRYEADEDAERERQRDEREEREERILNDKTTNEKEHAN